jgi:dTDP-4-dehydrorhamnose 3,5-epimerase
VKFETTQIPGVLIVKSDCHDDPRGTFVRIHSRQEFAAAGLNETPEQCSLSYNNVRGTVRGLHYQLAPYNEAKLVVCVAGSMFDVIVDLRKSSPAFGRALGIPLSADRDRTIYIPEGCAHGFQTLADNTTLLYMISQPYQASAARGIRWDDPALGLEWPIREGVSLSVRDMTLPLLSELYTFF